MIKEKQRNTRKASIVIFIIVMSYAITFPVNYVLTFDAPKHEYIVISKKDIRRSSRITTRYLYGYWNGKEIQFPVTKSEYNETSIGDMRRVCIKKSCHRLLDTNFYVTFF